MKEIDKAGPLGKRTERFKSQEKICSEEKDENTAKRKMRKMWTSVTHVSLLNGRSKPGFSSFCFIQRTHGAIKPWVSEATKVLDGLTLKASERKDFCTVVGFFQV